MPRRKVADMTLTQRTTHENDKFRAEQYAEQLEAQADATKPGRDDGSFRKDAYKQALRDAKASQ